MTTQIHVIIDSDNACCLKTQTHSFDQYWHHPRCFVVFIWKLYHEKYLNLAVACHDDVIKRKHFTRYWPFVRGFHRSPVNFPPRRPVTRSFDVFFDLHLNKTLSKQSWGCWFETPSCPLWRQCNVLKITPLTLLSHRLWGNSLIFTYVFMPT